jgi:hypothetical protein
MPSVSPWARRADAFSEPTAESRRRGFGPFGARTEKIRELAADIPVRRLTSAGPGVFDATLQKSYARLAEMLLAEAV